MDKIRISSTGNALNEQNENRSAFATCTSAQRNRLLSDEDFRRLSDGPRFRSMMRSSID